MSNDLILSNISGGLIESINKGALELPFANEIYLYTLPIAGITYYINETTMILQEGDTVILKREPNNKYDKYAIVVFSKSNEKLGYIPRANNKVFARLMDGGKLLIGKVKECNTDFEEIENIIIRIYLKDI